MLLFGLLLAAAVRAPLPLAAPKPDGPPAPVAAAFSHAPRMKGQRSAFECRQRVTQARETEGGVAKPLNRMPMGLGERAVMRMVDGCPVRASILQGPPRR